MISRYPVQALQLLALAALYSCARVETTHRIDASGLSADVEGSKLDLVYAADSIGSIVGSKLLVVVHPAETALAVGRYPEGNRDFESMTAAFERRTAELVWNTGIFFDVGTNQDARPLPEPDYRLDVYVTEWDEGAWALRALPIVWGGRVRVQIEGVLSPFHGEEPIFAFADARSHNGFGPLSPSTYRGEILIAKSQRLFLDGLQKTLLNLTARPVPERGLDPRVSPFRPPRPAPTPE